MCQPRAPGTSSWASVDRLSSQPPPGPARLHSGCGHLHPLPSRAGTSAAQRSLSQTAPWARGAVTGRATWGAIDSIVALEGQGLDCPLTLSRLREPERRPGGRRSQSRLALRLRPDSTPRGGLPAILGVPLPSCCSQTSLTPPGSQPSLLTQPAPRPSSWPPGVHCSPAQGSSASGRPREEPWAEAGEAEAGELRAAHEPEPGGHAGRGTGEAASRGWHLGLGGPLKGGRGCGSSVAAKSRQGTVAAGRPRVCFVLSSRGAPKSAVSR